MRMSFFKKSELEPKAEGQWRNTSRPPAMLVQPQTQAFHSEFSGIYLTVCAL